MRIKHKPWAEPFLESHKEFVITLDNFNDKEVVEFLNNENIYMEIGTGKGGFLLGMAKKNPDKFYLGVEINETAAGFCAKKIYENELKNVKLINIDVKYLFDHLPQNHFDGIYLNFSDPWPKERHAKRRLTSPVFLKKYDHIFKMGKEIQMKTDNRKLFEYSLMSLVDYGYKIKELSLNLYEDDHEDNVATEYETKFVKMGKIIYRALFSCD